MPAPVFKNGAGIRLPFNHSFPRQILTMTHFIKSLLMLLALSLTSWPAYADSLFDILQLALDNDPVLRQAEASYRANREP